MASWDNPYSTPQPGSAEPVSGTVTANQGAAGASAWPVTPGSGVEFGPFDLDSLTELRRIRIALAFLVQEFGGELTELVESDGEALEIAS
jgi:hypothetical protein